MISAAASVRWWRAVFQRALAVAALLLANRWEVELVEDLVVKVTGRPDLMEEAYEWLEWKGHHHLVASVTPGEVSAIVGMGTRGVPSRPKEEVGHVDWDRRASAYRRRGGRADVHSAARDEGL